MAQVLGYAFSTVSTASSYVFRPDASTSTAVPSSVAQQRGHKRRGSAYGGASGPLADGARAAGSFEAVEEEAFDAAGEALEGDKVDRKGKGPEVAPNLDPDKRKGEAMVDEINGEEDLYAILGLKKKCKADEVRRAFLGRSRYCHPDKLPHYPSATPAFQRLSFAYETLSKPSSRRLYDLGNGRGYDPGLAKDPMSAGGSDETLHGVLRSVLTEFLEGDFELIRSFVAAFREGNPNLDLGDDQLDTLEAAFKRVREVVLAGQKYVRIVKFELIRLYEIQHSLRSLSYFDVRGRFRLTLALARVTLEIPMVLDRAMRDEPAVPLRGLTDPAEDKENEQARKAQQQQTSADGSMLQRRGILGPRVKGVLVVACKVLEKGERWTAP